MKKFILKILFIIILILPLVSGEKIIPLEELKNPVTIIVDRGQILIAEFPTVFVYNQKTFLFEAKFGKKGDGPREFSQYIRIQKDPKNPDKIVVGSHMKISYFTRRGEYISEKRQKSGGLGSVFKPFGKRFLSYGFIQDKKSKTNYQTVNLFDSNLKKIKEIYRQRAAFTQGKKFNAIRTWGAWFRIYKDRIFITGEKEGVVFVYDKDGNEINKITSNSRRLKVGETDKKRFHNHFKTDPRSKNFYENFKHLITFPEYFPVIRGMDVVDGKIYINGYLDSKGYTHFSIFDLDGQVIKNDISLNLPEANAVDLFPYTIKDGKLYQLVDNDDEEIWELHIHNL